MSEMCDNSNELSIESHIIRNSKWDQMYVYCSECNFCTNDPKLLVRHQSTHNRSSEPNTNEKFFETLLKCAECDEYFTTEDKRTQHVTQTHKHLNFNDISHRFGAEDRLSNQLNRQSSDGGSEPELKVYNCSSIECTESFLDLMELREHSVQIHNRINCENCDKSFKTMSAVIEHQKRFHLTEDMAEQLMSCPICGHRYNCRTRFEKHVKAHDESNRFGCPDCPKSFNSELNREIHVNRDHKRVKPYVCEECDQRFYANEKLLNHLSAKHSIPVFGCDSCQYRTKRKDKLMIHKRSHKHNKEFVCNINDCSETFVSNYNLKIHEKLKHNVNTHHQIIVADSQQDWSSVYVKQENCDLEPNENQSYNSNDWINGFKNNSDNSLQTNTNEAFVGDLSAESSTQFSNHLKCFECNSTFDSYVLLRKHNEIHQKMKQKTKVFSKCLECELWFAPGDELNQHMNEIHGKTQSINYNNNKTEYNSNFSLLSERLQQKCNKTLDLNQTYEDLSGIDIKPIIGSDLQLKQMQSLADFRCNECNEEFGIEELLLRHLAQIHRIPSFQCDICGFKSMTRHQLQTHRERHTSGQPFDDNIDCNSIQNNSKTENNSNFSLITELLQQNSSYNKNLVKNFSSDIEEDNENGFQCQVCQQLFEKRLDLNQHMSASHTQSLIESDFETNSNSNGIELRLRNTKTSETTNGRKARETTQRTISFDDISQLKEQLNRNQSDFKCEKCPKIFENYYQLIQHRKAAHVGKDVLICPICGLKFFYKTSFKNHIKTHDNSLRIQCQVCGVGLKTELELEVHTNRDHNRVKPFVCSECSDSFFAKEQLLNHLSAKHKIPAFVCDLCDYKTCVKHTLTKHRARHSGAKQFKCNIKGCNKAFKVRQSLRNHKLYGHLEDRFRCDWNDCEQNFANKAALDRHMAAHMWERNLTISISERKEKLLFKCDKCLDSFDAKHQLLSHMLVKHKTCFECNLCQFKTFRKLLLTSHMKNRHSVDTEWFRNKTSLSQHQSRDSGRNRFACQWPGCSKQFGIKQLLDYHMSTHSGNKRYVCDQKDCQFRTSLQSDLKRHKLRHQKQIQCQITGCNRVFTFNYELCQHLKFTHKVGIVFGDGLRFRCQWPKCGHEMADKHEFDEHVLTHTSAKPFTCDWNDCMFKALSAQELDRHRTMHWKSIPCVDSTCTEVFANNRDLTLHLKTCHNIVSNSLCFDNNIHEIIDSFQINSNELNVESNVLRINDSNVDSIEIKAELVDEIE